MKMEDVHFRGKRKKQGQSPSPLSVGVHRHEWEEAPLIWDISVPLSASKLLPHLEKFHPGSWPGVPGSQWATLHAVDCTKPQRDLRNWWKWGVKSGVKVRRESRALFGGWILVTDLLNKQEPLEVTFFPIDKEVYIQVFISAFLKILKMSNSIIKHVKLKG